MQYNDPSTKIYIYSFSSDSELVFESFITDFSDTYTANWSGQDVYGRMDPVYTYKNTVRKITLAFDVPSFSLVDAQANSIKVNNFVNSMYPVYFEEGNGLGVATMQTPPLFKLRMGNNLIKSPSSIVASSNTSKNNSLVFSQGLLGYIDNFSFKPDVSSGFLTDNRDNLYAKLFKVNFTFFVIHEYPLGNIVNTQTQHVTRLQLSQNKANEEAKNTTSDDILTKAKELINNINSLNKKLGQ